MNVLVTHPGRQHSHQLARALHQNNLLAGYWTGVPAADPKTKGILYELGTRYSPQPTLDLPGEQVNHNYVMPITRRIAEGLLPASMTVSLRHRAAAWFDAWAARRLPTDVDAVVAYENAARDTFRAAQKYGITTVLDAASLHHDWQDAVYQPVEPSTAHRRITRRKDDEISLADHILTVSSLACESYIEAGVSQNRITTVPMGADLSIFTPNRECSAKPFTFIFVGHANRLKGVDLLLSASDQLSQRLDSDYRVQFAGGYEEELFGDTTSPVELLGYLSSAELKKAFHRADCLVLPSRFDSFGRVVVEAMATGLPAIVSENVGAKEAVDEGETGWVVPVEDVEALVERMHWCVEHSEQVHSMSANAIKTAQNYSWTKYHDQVTEVLTRVVSRHG